MSSEISNAPIILNVDCDMYANDPDAIQDALCFFLDEKHGSPISYVQYPQHYHNIVDDDVYANRNYATNDVYTLASSLLSVLMKSIPWLKTLASSTLQDRLLWLGWFRRRPISAPVASTAGKASPGRNSPAIIGFRVVMWKIM